MPKTTGERFERAVEIMARLRGPGGCPWDREQTFDSIKPYTLEETYEVLEAIDNRDWQELPGELGDLLLQVLFYSEMAREQGSFSIDDVLERLSSKLVTRHPHVFGDVQAETSGEVLRNWERIKAEEKKQAGTQAGEEPGTRESVLAGVSERVPSLLAAHKLSARAAHAGFDWPSIEGVFEKLSEEIRELEDELKQYPAPGPLPPGGGVASSGQANVSAALQQRLEEEVGDLFFTAVNLARYLSVDSESALRKANRKFKRRFQAMEAKVSNSGRTVGEVAAAELNQAWDDVKRQERAGK